MTRADTHTLIFHNITPTLIFNNTSNAIISLLYPTRIEIGPYPQIQHHTQQPLALPSSSSTPNTTHPYPYPIPIDIWPKRPRAKTTRLLRPKRSTPKIGQNDPGRNNTSETTQGQNHPDSLITGREEWRKMLCVCGGGA